MPVIAVRESNLAARAIDPTAARWKLTPGERRLLERVVDGLAMAEIARRLGDALDTVKTQVAAVTRKAGCQRQTAVLGRC